MKSQLIILCVGAYGLISCKSLTKMYFRMIVIKMRKVTADVILSLFISLFLMQDDFSIADNGLGLTVLNVSPKGHGASLSLLLLK